MDPARMEYPENGRFPSREAPTGLENVFRAGGTAFPFLGMGVGSHAYAH